jgi:hypothetical protein
MTTTEPEGTVIVFWSNRKFSAVSVTGAVWPPPDDNGTLVVGGTVWPVPEGNGALVDGSTIVMAVSVGEPVVVVTTDIGVGPEEGVDTAGGEEVHPAVATPKPIIMIRITP